MGDLSNYIKKRGDVNSITATDPGTPPLKPTTNGLNEYVVRHFLKQLGILNIFILFLRERRKFVRKCSCNSKLHILSDFTIHGSFIIYIFFQQTRWSF